MMTKMMMSSGMPNPKNFTMFLLKPKRMCRVIAIAAPILRYTVTVGLQRFLPFPNRSTQTALRLFTQASELIFLQA